MDNLANISTSLGSHLSLLGPMDLLDIAIVISLFYVILILLKRAHSFFIFGGMLVLFGIYIVARYLDLYLTSMIFQAFLGFVAVIFVVIFQRELRHFFEWLTVWGRLSGSKRESVSDYVSGQLMRSIRYMAEHKMGALIVLVGHELVDDFIEGGTFLDGRVSFPLLISIFDASSPGHDGAVILEGSRIKKFGAHLPLAERFEDFEKYGTRHRAAAGITEHTDALVIIVSEERGTVSISQDGKLRELTDIEVLQDEISKFFKEEFFNIDSSRWSGIFTENWREKFLAVAMGLILWFVFVVQLGTGPVTRQYDVAVEFGSLPENYSLEQVETKDISLILSGRRQDFNLLDESRLKIMVSLTDLKDGQHKIPVTQDIISAPPSLNIVSFTPQYIKFRLKQK
jgi:uncharacterized protein (TIGR00159 family)